jgi:hypothetical protein
MSTISPDTENAFLKLLRNPIKFRFFLMKELPAAYFSGLKLKEVTSHSCSVSIPFKWFTKNPFRSTYFACLSMAAEMTTGILAMAAIYKRSPRVSMLIVKNEAVYHKKAVGVTTFICKDGEAIRQAVIDAVTSGNATSVTSRSEGFTETGEMVASFSFTWSFKMSKKE